MFSASEPTGIASADDTDFAAMYDAFLSGDADELALFSQRLNNSPLEVYASYYQLRLNLETIAPDPVRAFLARPADTPLIERLRVEWLKFLGKSQQWDLFDEEFPRLVNGGVELACYAMQSRLRTRETATLREARLLWMDGKSLPDSCTPLFDAARAGNIIQTNDIRQRLRLALESGNMMLASQLAVLLEEKSPKGLPDELEKAAADPDRYLNKLSLKKNNEDRRLIVLFALQRLAKQNPGAAERHWKKLSSNFQESERNYFYAKLAYEAARNHDDRALQWYKAADGYPHNEQQLAWRVRAALRAQDWPEVLSGIGMMRSQQQREPAWRYWKARALQSLGKASEATALLAPLSAEPHFYGQLADAELKDEPVLSEQQFVFKPSESSIADIQARPGIQRTIALYRAGLRSEALEEWRWAIRGMNDRELLTAAEIARRNGMYDRAIGAANMTVNLHDFGLRYLAPYRNALQAHVRENDLDEAWVYGLMRQESRFSPGAKSPVGASGLMQIMPSTARWVAKKLGLKDYRNALLHDLDTNLRLGTYYMKAVLTQSDNSPALASAAYNAGPLRALQWRAEKPLEGAIFAETIPFEETREYVKKVMSNTVYYADQFGAPPRSLKERLGVIPARSADNDRNKPLVP